MGKIMRLTVFNINDIDLDLYRKSYQRILNETQQTIPHNNKNTYVAIFNGSILGICSTEGNCINYFHVLEITRNRGVGTHLFNIVGQKLIDTFGKFTISNELIHNYPTLAIFFDLFKNNNFEFKEISKTTI